MKAIVTGLSLLLAGIACPLLAQGTPPLWGVAVEGRPSPGQIHGEETRIPVHLVSFFQQWPEAPAARDFPLESIRAIRDAGAVPIITWEPMYYRAGGEEVMVPAQKILDGTYDGYIDDYARRAAAWPGPIIIRLAHEMNLGRYHWGTDAAGYGPGSPALYRDLWRHVVTRFRQAGAANVLFAFCPNAEPVPATPWNRIEAYYPGDEWVHLVGIDGYNWGDTQTPEKHGWRSQWRSFADIFGAARTTLRQIAPAKPLIIFETATASTGGNKAQWLRDAAATASTWNVRGVVWFQVNKEVDWRLQTAVEPAVLDELRARFSPAEATVRGWSATR